MSQSLDVAGLPPSPQQFGLDVLHKLQYTPKVMVNAEDLSQVIKEAKQTVEEAKVLKQQLDIIRGPRIIKLENQRWKDQYDGTSRKNLLSYAKNMREQQTKLMEIVDAIGNNIQAMIQDYSTYMNRIIGQIAFEANKAASVVDDMENELIATRRHRLVINLGFPGPVEYSQPLATMRGRLQAPNGYARQLSEEFLLCIPKSEFSPMTATEQILKGTVGPVRKWVPEIAHHMMNYPDTLYPNLLEVEAVRQTYAPGTDPFTITTTEFYKDQTSADWYSMTHVRGVLQAQRMARAEAAYREKKENEEKRAAALAKEIDNLELKEEEQTDVAQSTLSEESVA
jgi:hypothetical protein